MKIELSSNGHLSLDRKGKLKTQYCPFFTGDYKEACGDWCPLFGEPKIKENAMPKFTEVIIGICQDRLLSCAGENFKDLREENK